VRPGIDFHDPAVPAVSHYHPGGVARQALGRSSRNARVVFEDGLAGLLGIRQDLGIDVDHHLVALAPDMAKSASPRASTTSTASRGGGSTRT